MHLLHLCVRVSQIRKVPDSDLGWEDMYREGEGSSWMDWVSMLPFLRKVLLMSSKTKNADSARVRTSHCRIFP